MNDGLTEITAYLHEHIPLTRHLGAIVSDYDQCSITLRAPLTPNLNHRNTAFGGSISALAILSGWALLHLQLRQLNFKARLVIQKSEVDFSAPITEDFEAVSYMPQAADCERSLKTLRRRRRARVNIHADVRSALAVGGQHVGTYVAEIL